MAKKKKSSRQKSSEDAAKRLKKEELARMHAEARQEIVQRRILAAEEMAANRTKLHFLSSKAISTGPVDTFGPLPIEVKLQMFKNLTDIDSLHSLISASRSFHECYINDKYQCEVFCKEYMKRGTSSWAATMISRNIITVSPELLSTRVLSSFGMFVTKMEPGQKFLL